MKSATTKYNIDNNKLHKHIHVDVLNLNVKIIFIKIALMMVTTIKITTIKTLIITISRGKSFVINTGLHIKVLKE